MDFAELEVKKNPVFSLPPFTSILDPSDILINIVLYLIINSNPDEEKYLKG